MSSPTVLLVFCKAPVVGEVKTRLAKAVGEQQALKLYRQMLSQNLQLATALENVSVVIATNNPQHAFFRPWREKGVEVIRQSKGDLGDRLIHAFETQFMDALSPTGLTISTDSRFLGSDGQRLKQCILIGVDTFDITVDHLQKAIDKLQTHDAVITPVEDGGYILIGLKQLHRAVFENIAWSTPQVFEQTMRRFDELGLSVYELPRLKDVDEVGDLQVT